MIQRIFTSEHGEEKQAYEFSRGEFDVLVQNLRLFGHAGRMAIIKANDPQAKLRPRMAPIKEAVEVLHEIFDNVEDAELDVTVTDLDVLRYDRAEVQGAIRNLKLIPQKNAVVLGLSTVASALNDLRSPIVEGSVALHEPELMKGILHEFHEHGVERIMKNTHDIV